MSYFNDSELARNRRAQDRVMAERHRGFDLAAQDNTPKHCRFRFSVVGEGSRSAQENFRRNIEQIDWEA